MTEERKKPEKAVENPPGDDKTTREPGDPKKKRLAGQLRQNLVRRKQRTEKGSDTLLNLSEG